MNDDKISELLEQQCKTVQICLNTLMDHRAATERILPSAARVRVLCRICYNFYRNVNDDVKGGDDDDGVQKIQN